MNGRERIRIVAQNMASEITRATSLFSTFSSSQQQRHHHKGPKSLTSLAYSEGNPSVSGGLPSQKACNMENASLSWRHHEDVVMYLPVGWPMTYRYVSLQWRPLVNICSASLIRFPLGLWALLSFLQLPLCTPGANYRALVAVVTYNIQATFGFWVWHSKVWCYVYYPY